MVRFTLSVILFSCLYLPVHAQMREQIIQAGHSGFTSGLAFQDGNKRLVTVGPDNYIILWDVWTGRELKRWNAGIPLFDVHAYHNSTTCIITGYSAKTFILKTDHPHIEASLFAHDNNIKQAIFESSDSIVFESDYDSGLYTRHAGNDQAFKKITSDKYIDDMIYDTLAHKLLCASDSSVSYIDENSKQLQPLYRGAFPITHIGLSASHGKIAFCQKLSETNFRVSVMDMRTQKIQVAGDFSEEVTKLFFLDNKNLLAIADRQRITIFDLNSDSSTASLQYDRNYNQLATDISPDENYIAASYADGKILIWDIVSGSIIRTLGGYSNDLSVEAAAIHPETGLLYTSTPDRFIRIWDIRRQTLVQKFEYANAYGPFLLDFIKNNKIITISSDKGFFTNSRQKPERNVGTGIITQACLSPDKKMVVRCKDDSVIINETRTGKQVKEYGLPDFGLATAINQRGQVAVGCGNAKLWFCDIRLPAGNWIAAFDNPAQCLRFSPNGNLLAAGDRNDGKIHLISINGEKNLEWKAHTGTVTSLVWLSDSIFISGNETGEIRKWNIRGKRVADFDGQSSRVTSLIAMVRANKLISTGEDGGIKFWDLKKHALLATLKPVGPRSDNFISYLPSGYYRGTKRGIQSINYAKGPATYNVEQFDLYYNRPDRVLRSIGLATDEDIQLLRKLYLKRMSLYGAKPATTKPTMTSSNAPEVHIEADNGELIRRSDRNAELTISATDHNSRLVKLFAFVNGVPVFGSRGLSLPQDSAKKTLNYHFQITLSRGENTIEVSVMNENSVESLPDSLHLFYLPANK